MKIIQPPRGMTVQCWAVVSLVGPVVSGFPTAEAAHAWATEWNATVSVVAPVCGNGEATAALAAYEAHRQR